MVDTRLAGGLHYGGVQGECVCGSQAARPPGSANSLPLIGPVLVLRSGCLVSKRNVVWAVPNPMQAIPNVWAGTESGCRIMLAYPKYIISIGLGETRTQQLFQLSI